MFRRRRREGVDQPDLDDLGDDGEDLADPGDAGPEALRRDYSAGRTRGRGRERPGPIAGAHAAGQTGPWDGAGSYPHGDRIDFGSLLVPTRQGLDVQVNMAEDQAVWVAVVQGESGLQLQAFAAPKTSGLWDEVRGEIADEVAKSGGESQEAQGPFGTELRAQVNPAEPGQRRQQLQQVRFLGVDGPRWFLRGVISGPAARRAELAKPFEEVFGDVVVVRGDHPAPPRDLLAIRLPEEARQALDEQMADAGEEHAYPNPFDRGPEITETR